MQKKSVHFSKKLPQWITPLVIIYTTIILLAYLFTGFFFFEWIISFLPYILGINCILLGLQFFLFRPSKQKTTHPLFSYVFACLLFATILFAVRFNDFVFRKPPMEKGEIPITIAFFNKNHRNTNYDATNHALQKLNPDILGVAELNPDDQEKIPFLQTYAYAKTVTLRDHFTIGLFSRFPIAPILFNTDKTHAMATKVTIQDKDYTVIVAHPYPPTSTRDMQTRNEELTATLSYATSLKNNNVLLLGDLNITPWSPVYQQLFASQSAITNAAKGQGLFFTWGHFFIRAHIDHIFVPTGTYVESFDDQFVPGSDHYLIQTKLLL